MTSTTTFHRRRWAILGALAAASLVAAGCGSDDDKGSSDSSKRAKPPTVQEVSTPTVDDDLTKEMGDDGAALTKAGCTFGTFEEESPDHVDEDDLEWKTFPPTSGRHLEEWAPFGVYDEHVPDGYAVHNLEHGGVNVWLGKDLDDELVTAVGKLPKDEEKWLVAPRDDMKGLFAAAWAKGLSCPPAAIEQLDVATITDGLRTWYETVNSTGSDAEKDVPAYAGSMKEPTPERDVSADSPF